VIASKLYSSFLIMVVLILKGWMADNRKSPAFFIFVDNTPKITSAKRNDRSTTYYELDLHRNRRKIIYGSLKCVSFATVGLYL
jgi:hypothetical protein